MDIHIRSRTCYNGEGTNNIPDRLHIVDSIEQVFDSDVGCSSDLFLPNSFITTGSNHDFWLWMAVLMCEGGDLGDLKDWHVLEYGTPLNENDCRQLYVYTWTLGGFSFRFFTKTVNDGYRSELVWYIGKSKNSSYSDLCDDLDSSEDTESDEMVLYTHSRL